MTSRSPELDADAAELLAGWAAVSTVPVNLQPLEVSRGSGLVNAAVTGPSVELAEVTDAHVSGPGGDVPIRIYRPHGGPRRPAIVYAHGGGWTLLSIESADAACRRLADEVGADVVSVGYRLAPEHPFPAAFDDTWAVVEWVAAGGLGQVPTRLAVAGDSAGGNLAAGIAVHAREVGGPRIDLQLLLYPSTSPDVTYDSMQTLGHDPRFRLTPEIVTWFWRNYVGDERGPLDHRAAPGLAESLHGVAPAIVITCGYDPLKDDGAAYARRLQQHGVTATHIEFATLPHGFVMMFGAVPAAAAAFSAVAAAARDVLRPLPPVAVEFRERPFGTHSAELQTLLYQMRGAPIAGKHFLFISHHNSEWALGRYTDEAVPVPGVDWSTRFTTLEAAEWHVFKVRWREMFGEDLADPEPPAGVVAADGDVSADEAERRARLERSPAVLAYADRRGLRAGERIDFHVSSAGGQPYDARLVRLRSSDIGPLGRPFEPEPVTADLTGRHDGVEQPIRIGSCAVVDDPIDLAGGFRFRVLVEPTIVGARPATIAHFQTAAGDSAELVHSRDGVRVIVRVGEVATSVELPPLLERRWQVLELAVGGGSLSLRHEVLAAGGALERPAVQADTALAPTAGFGATHVVLAASFDRVTGAHLPTSVFDGKLERPQLTTFDGVPVATWDFAIGISSDAVTDTVGAHHGRLVNLPTRGTRGSTWTGDQLSWRQDSESYAAIHFHSDDLGSAGWARSLSFDAPPDLASGCYALVVEPADRATPEWYVPFAVRPAAGASTSDAAFVLPTTTYAAYANMHLRVTAQFNELAHGRLTVLDSTDFLLMRRPELGKSTYDVHADGSPVIYSSMARPVTNFRPTGRMYKFCLDLFVVDWLDATGHAADVITDDDIDAEGLDAMSPYRVLITGSHPEYTSRRQFDAWEAYLAGGGRMMYLGGNGFYSSADVLPFDTDAVEVRRPGQDNLWRVNHAEAVASSTGLPGGMWRNIGRPENALTGVGFITQGFDACTFYRRAPASRDPRVAWIFDGLADDAVIGDFGILQGGAAGYEIDRHDPTKGSPAHSVVVASSGGHSNVYDLMVPSILETLPDPRRTVDPIRADMVFFETGHGGAVFSVGSIAWAGSLSHGDYDNSVSRVTANVLDRFADPTPFVAPTGD